MTGIIERIFGRTSGITIEDVEGCIAKGTLLETFEIECKELDRVQNKKDRNEKIISPLVSFLNSGLVNGLLCLGFETEGKKIINIKGVGEHIRDEAALRAIIYNKIDSIPEYIKRFNIDIQSVKLDGNKSVFFVEIYNFDRNCVYYSKISNQSYIRRGDEDKPLSIPKFLELISQKNHARIFVNVDKTNKEDNYLNFSFTMINKGLEPGKYVTSVFQIITLDDIKYDFQGKLIKLDSEEKLNTDKKGIYAYKKQYKVVTGYPPTTILIYPKLSTTIGDLKIDLSNPDIQENFSNVIIIVSTFENRGYTQQFFNISYKDSEPSIKETSSVFRPYMAI